MGEIVNAFSKLKEEGEGAAIQLVFKPARRWLAERNLKIAREMQKNKTFAKAERDTSFVRHNGQGFGRRHLGISKTHSWPVLFAVNLNAPSAGTDKSARRKSQQNWF